MAISWCEAICLCSHSAARGSVRESLQYSLLSWKNRVPQKQLCCIFYFQIQLSSIAKLCAKRQNGPAGSNTDKSCLGREAGVKISSISAEII